MKETVGSKNQATVNKNKNNSTKSVRKNLRDIGIAAPVQFFLCLWVGAKSKILIRKRLTKREKKLTNVEVILLESFLSDH